MGRYDKIRVYSGGWKQPSRIRMYKKGSWVDFGANDSDNKSDIYVYKKSSNNFVRATLDKQVTNTSYKQGTGYTESSWSPGFSCGFSPYSKETGHFRFEFKATIYRRDSVSRTLYSSKSKSNGNCHVYITLNGNGSITVSINSGNFYDDVATYTTPATLSKDQWGYLQVWAEAGSERLYIKWCGVTYNMTSRRAWKVDSNTTINSGGARISTSEFKLQTYSNNTGGTQTITKTAAQIEIDVASSETTWV